MPINDAIRDRLSKCTVDVARWCASRPVQLNPDKTDVIWFGSGASDGGYIGIYTPKISPSKLFMG